MMQFYFSYLNQIIIFELAVVIVCLIKILTTTESTVQSENSFKKPLSKDTYLWEIEQFFSDESFIPQTPFGKILTADYKKIQNELQDRKTS